MLGLNWGGQRVGWKWEQEALAMVVEGARRVGGVRREGGWNAHGEWLKRGVLARKESKRRRGDCVCDAEIKTMTNCGML
jgi:hypothetical protein